MALETSGMALETLIAFAALTLALISAVFAGIKHALYVAYQFGQADRDRASMKSGIAELQVRAGLADANHGDTALLKQSVETLRLKLEEVAGDVKSILTRKPTTSR